MKNSIYLLLMLCAYVANAQNVLYLKNGTILHGMILVLPDTNTIAIKIAGDNLLIYNKSEVLNFRKENSTKNDLMKNRYGKQGLFNLNEMGVQLGDDRSSVLQTMIGYRFQKRYYASLGAGVCAYYQETLSYLFFDARADLFAHGNTPFLFCDIGLTSNFFFPDHTNTGLYFNIGGGNKIYLFNNLMITLSAGYSTMRNKYTGAPSNFSDVSLKGIFVKAGDWDLMYKPVSIIKG